ncbi:MAG: CBS domain-containing protein [Thermodesulfovibrionales bacterium]|nr:CBS domain-containing protein [Thermodesulfovibrionales bacterium]
MYNEYYTEGGRDEAKGHFRYEDDFGDNVGDVIRTMAEKNIGCVIVKENGDILGIFTERDILMCHAKGISLNNEIVKDVMTKNPLTFNEATDVSVALTVMCGKNIRYLLVATDDKVDGVISFRDIIRYFMPEICYLAEQVY